MTKTRARLGGGLQRTVCAAIVSLFLMLMTIAQGYILPWNSVNSGGRQGASASFVLNGSASQTIQGQGASASRTGKWGFWNGFSELSVVLVYPAGGETFAPGSEELIRWTVSGDVTQGDSLWYSTDDGTNWQNLLGTATPVTSYLWNVPDKLSTACRVKVKVWNAIFWDTAISGRFSIQRPVPGWTAQTDLLPGSRNKGVRDGGALAYQAFADNSPEAVTGIYALKGNNTYEVYRYTFDGDWTALDSIPAYNSLNKKKAVKKGSSLVLAGSKLYATKGNGTLDFWEYDLAKDTGWVQKLDVPSPIPPGKARGVMLKEGTGAVFVPADRGTLDSPPRTRSTDRGQGEPAGSGHIYLLKGSGTTEFYRYDVAFENWTALPNAPLSGRTKYLKPYKSGSVIAYDGNDTIYTVKGNYNEFYAYSVSAGQWYTLETIPRGLRKKKVKDGAGLAYADGSLYLLKGNNTYEFWTYNCATRVWQQLPDIGYGSLSKRVKGGGALVAAGNYLYATKGNGTLEFWRYGPIGARSESGIAGDKAQVAGNRSQGAGRVSLLVSPNPYANVTEVFYSVAKPGRVSLKLYDITGKLVSTLASGFHNVGTHSLSIGYGLQGLDDFGIASGVYLLKLETRDGTVSRKLIAK